MKGQAVKAVKTEPRRIPGLLEGMQIIQTPMLDVSAIRRTRQGAYTGVVEAIMRLDTTTMDSGWCPRVTWYCETQNQLRTRLSSLRGARARLVKEDPRYLKAEFIQRLNPDRPGHWVIYLWHEV